MRKFAALVVLVLLTGCSGLHVQWVATATYNTPAPVSPEITVAPLVANYRIAK